MIKRAVALVLIVATACTALPLLAQNDPSAAPLLAGRVHARHQPEDGKIYVLVIGSDARSGNPNARADAIHLAGINTKTMKGGIINFPRDSWVNIPRSGSGRINEALYRGGPDLLASTVESLTGIRIDYWVLTGFVGFIDAVNAVHGIPFKVGRAVYDPGGSGAKIPANTKWLRGSSALAYARTRKAFPNGDIDRTTNQGKLLLALLRKFRSEVGEHPSQLLDWATVAKRYTRLNIRPDELFRLGVLASQVKPSDVGNVTLPVSVGSVGAASVVFIRSQARSIYARFRQKGSL
jgi:LCP family protein required for cell wall assembly